MKTIIFVLVTLFSQISFSQDLITFKDGSVKSVNVKEISETEVKYQKTENTSVIYSVLKTSLFSIQFKNGDKEVFNQPLLVPQITNTVAEPKTVAQPEWIMKKMAKTPAIEEKYDVIVFTNDRIQKCKIDKVTESNISYIKAEEPNLTYSAEMQNIKSFMFRSSKKENSILGNLINQPVVKAPTPTVIQAVEKLSTKLATLTFKSGTVKSVIVIELTDTAVKYTKDENTSTIYTALKTDLLSIEFKDEKKEALSQKVTAPPTKNIAVIEEQKFLNVANNSKSISYKGFVEVSYATSPFTKSVGSSSTLGQAIDIATVSTSHGILISNMLFIGAGGSYLKTLKSDGADGYCIFGDLRIKVLDFGKANLLIGGKGGILVSDKYSGNKDANATLKGGLMLNPFISTEINVSQSNNLVITAGYRSQRYVIDANVYNSSLGRTVTSRIFNDDFEYLNFSVGISF